MKCREGLSGSRLSAWFQVVRASSGARAVEGVGVPSVQPGVGRVGGNQVLVGVDDLAEALRVDLFCGGGQGFPAFF